MDRIYLQNLSSKIKTFLSSHKDAVFCALSAVLAFFVGYFMHSNWLNLCLGIVISSTVYLRLLYANIEIENKLIRLGWAFINLALFIFICKICAIESDKTGETTYVFGLFASIFTNTILYVYIPLLSYKMKLIDNVHGWKIDWKGNTVETKTNSDTVSIMLSIILAVIGFCCEVKHDNDLLFDKEPYVSVYSWDKEVHDRHIVYIVSTEKGRFAISPQKYPDIRDINSNTKIKILTTGTGGLYSYYRLDIKN
jgi:hypothetical protein